jgi:hypothetical protein
MNDSGRVPQAPIRLLFELEREDNPRLYDDLVRFRKGTKRVNRLRTLAQEGLLAQGWAVGFMPTAPQALADEVSHESTEAALTNEVFGKPLDE